MNSSVNIHPGVFRTFVKAPIIWDALRPPGISVSPALEIRVQAGTG